MARGFESKDVEFQQSEAERRQVSVAPMSDAQRQRVSARRTVELALTHAKAELAATSSAVRRRTLAHAIVELESQLSTAPAEVAPRPGVTP